MIDQLRGRMMVQSSGFAAQSESAPLEPYRFERRTPDAHDIVIDILYCGVCHTDLSMVDNEWGYGLYPMVPGHEIVGRVTAVGDEVTRFAPGDLAGIGPIVDSCRRCVNCAQHDEQYCTEYPTQTYSTPDRKGAGAVTMGGYSNDYVVDEQYSVRIPERLDPARTAPLLCAGITTYSPLKRAKIGPGHRVGVVGLGGLGHVAVKFARAMGAEVVVFTTSPAKVADALRLGASDVVLSNDGERMAAGTGGFDFILNTISAAHALEPYLALLKVDGTMCLLGMPAEAMAIHAAALLIGRKRLAGSGVGGIAETQEMLEFAAEHGIGADIETIPLAQVNSAFERLRRNDVKYRFVIDMAA